MLLANCPTIISSSVAGEMINQVNRLLLIRRVLWRKLQYSCWWRCVPRGSFIKSVYLTTWSIVRIIERRTIGRAVKNWTDLKWSSSGPVWTTIP